MKIAKKILQEICYQHRRFDKLIMQGTEGERLHGLDVLSWVEKLNPQAAKALKLAALFHDIDRVVNPKMGGGFKGDRNSASYLNHKKRHAKRSANYIIPILRKNGASAKILKQARFLITHHDDSGEEVSKKNNQDLNTLVSADSFAFFTSIAPKLYKAEGKERIKDKIKFMVEKLPGFSRIALWEKPLADKFFNGLKNEIIKEYYLVHNPREKEFIFCPSCKTVLHRKKIDNRNLLNCSKCGFTFWNNPKPVVSVVLKKRGKILLIQRNKAPLKGYWCLPGGYVNYEEAPEAAAVRETKEETSLDIKINKLIGVFQIDNDPRGVNLDLIYSGKITKGKIKLNAESSKYHFFPFAKLPELIAYKHREALKK